MTAAHCGTCDQQIIDTQTDSIACDACQKWVHAKKECSNTKKSIFNILSKKDTWLCPSCVQLCKTNISRISTLKNELENHSKLAQNLLNENKSLKQQLNEKEIKIIELQEKINQGGENWTKVGKKSKRGWESALNSTLETSNRFEPLVDSGMNEVIDHCSAEPKSHAPHKPKYSAGRARPKILVVGDSHVRGCKERLGRTCNGKWDVQARFLPGAPMGKAIKSASQNLRNLGETGVTIMVGGVNDVSDGGISDTLSEASHLEGWGCRKIVWVEAPFRHDDLSENQKIENFNKEIKKRCIKNNWTFLSLNCMLDRNHYTPHGLHLNHKGKDILCGIISNYIHHAEFPAALKTTPVENQSKNLLETPQQNKT